MKIVIIDYIKPDPADKQAKKNSVLSEWDRILSSMDPQELPETHLVLRGPDPGWPKPDHLHLHFINDDFSPQLRWCDNPASLHQIAAGLNPDLVHVYDLDLPLHFRWLRRKLPEKTRLIGQHTGKHIWIQLRLFLQQLALRSVNGFIFLNSDLARPWLKAGVILAHQPISEIPEGIPYKKKAELLMQFYRRICADT